MESLKEAIHEERRLEDRLQQKEAAARILMAGQRTERLAQLRVAIEAIRASNQPEVELVFVRLEVGEQLSMVALRVLNQVPRMYLEELRKQQAGGVGEVRAPARLDLRKVALTHGRVHLGGNGAYELLLGHRPAQASETAFDLPEILQLVAELHIVLPIAIFISHIAIHVKKYRD